MSKRGFSLIEVIIVIAVLVVVSGFTLGVGSEFYNSRSLIAERDSLVALLRRARINAMNNTNQMDQGVFLGSSEYVIFQGNSYAGRNSAFDETFPRLGGVTIEGPTEVVFSALEGASNASGTIAIVSASGRAEISINYEGRISW